MKLLGGSEIAKRMNQKDVQSKAKLYAALISIQNAMNNIGADGREIVLSMWLEQTLGSEVMAKLIEPEEDD